MDRQIFYADCRKAGELTEEQINTLFELRNIDKEARDILIQYNTKLVTFLLGKYKGIAEYEDLISSGTIGLIEAIDKYDPSRNVKFSYFAKPYIISGFMDEARAKYHLSTTKRAYCRIVKFKQELNDLETNLKRKPTKEEVIKKLGIEGQTYDRYIRLIDNATSIDKEISQEDGDAKLSNEINTGFKTPEENFIEKDSKEKLYEAINNILTKEEAFVIVNAFGLNGNEPVSCFELSRRIGKYGQYCLNVKTRAIKKLRKTQYMY